MDRRHARFLWLVGAPTSSCFAAWGALLLQSPHESPGTPYMISGVLPLAGLVAIGRYRWHARDRVLLAPYVPYALASVVFVVSMIELGKAVAREPDGAFIPIVQLGVGFLLPFIALIGGLTSFVMTGPRR